jgi:hypothetical protein
LVGAAVLWVPLGLIDSTGQLALHRASVHPDHTALNTLQLPAFATPKTFVYRDVNGSLHRILVDETELNRFVNDTLIYLDTERDKIKAETQREVDELIKTAFSDGQACIARYADWYFQWGRSLSFLKESLVGGMEGLSISNVQTVSESAQNALESYLIRNYEQYVLRSELRNPVIEAGVSQILAKAHTRYLETLTTIDDRVQLFLGQYTRHLEQIDPLKKLDVSVDWDAQKWKAPRYSADNVAFASAFQGVAVSTLVAKTFGPPIERAVAQIFLTVAARVVAGLQFEIYGTIGGTFIEPGGGSLPAGLPALAPQSYSITFPTGSGSALVAPSLSRPAQTHCRPRPESCPGHSNTICFRPSTCGLMIHAQSSPNRISVESLARRSCGVGKKQAGTDSGWAFGASVADRVQNLGNGGSRGIRRETKWWILPSNFVCALPSVRVGAVLHPAVIFALADRAGLFKQCDGPSA